MIPHSGIVLGKTFLVLAPERVSRKTGRIAIMRGLDWPYKPQASVFAGTQRYAEKQVWESIVDEYAPFVSQDGGILFSPRMDQGDCPWFAQMTKVQS